MKPIFFIETTLAFLMACLLTVSPQFSAHIKDSDKMCWTSIIFIYLKSLTSQESKSDFKKFKFRHYIPEHRNLNFWRLIYIPEISRMYSIYIIHTYYACPTYFVWNFSMRTVNRDWLSLGKAMGGFRVYPLM